LYEEKWVCIQNAERSLLWNLGAFEGTSHSISNKQVISLTLLYTDAWNELSIKYAYIYYFL